MVGQRHEMEWYGMELASAMSVLESGEQRYLKAIIIINLAFNAHSIMTVISGRAKRRRH